MQDFVMTRSTDAGKCRVWPCDDLAPHI